MVCGLFGAYYSRCRRLFSAAEVPQFLPFGIDWIHFRYVDIVRRVANSIWYDFFGHSELS